MPADNYFISDQNASYFLTFTVVNWLDVFTRKEYKIVVVDSLNYCIKNKGLTVFIWCLMSNHLHLVCRAKERNSISAIVRDFKKFTSKAIVKMIQEIPESRRDWLLYHFESAGKFDNRIQHFKFWQETNHAVLLDTSEKIDQRINYTHENPVKALIVAQPHEYLFSSAIDYSGTKGLVDVEIDV
ncbi:transposase [uncultured Draconibacterium sp.]|uniref:REP-associated tyrosine transposase n=1 Tax=uncultured Draconibacterium sp. TaxID=1573823 RepID=UPI0029C9A429|nr:transposase [uncultured Draconibacterium sp.]